MSRTTLKPASASVATFLLLLGWTSAAVADEQVSFYPEAKLAAADGRGGDSFGAAVAMSGDTVVIGADQDNDLATSAGAAYVFGRDPLDPDRWLQTAKLTAADGGSFASFGGAIAISGASRCAP